MGNPNFVLGTERRRTPLTSGERRSIAVLGVIALMTFFFPLLWIHVPIAGDQTFTGDDAVSRIGSTSPFPPNAGPNSSLPWSIRWFALTPIRIVVAPACALLTVVGRLRPPRFRGKEVLLERCAA